MQHFKCMYKWCYLKAFDETSNMTARLTELHAAPIVIWFKRNISQWKVLFFKHLRYKIL